MSPLATPSIIKAAKASRNTAPLSAIAPTSAATKSQLLAWAALSFSRAPVGGALRWRRRFR